MRAKTRGKRATQIGLEPPPANRRGSIVTHVAAGALILCFVAQCVASMARQSATYDEPVYIAAGYSYVKTGDFRLKQDAPPLVSTLSGLALEAGTYFGNTLVLDTGSRLWSARTEYPFARQFLAAAGDRRRTLQIARTPVVLIGGLLALYLYAFGRRVIGGYGALVPLFLFCFDPNMIAHARVVSNDMAVAAFFFIAHYYYYRALTEEARSNLLAAGAASALATVAKFSGLLVFPSLALVSALVYVFPAVAPMLPPGRKSEQRRRILRIAWQTLAVSLLAAVVAIGALYQSPDGVARYAAGVRSIYTNGVPDFQFYLFGAFSRTASWYYYLLAMLVKTPDVTLVLLAAAALSLFVPGAQGGWGAWLLAPVALALAVCSQDPVTLGLRRVLLVYPFLFLWIGMRCRAVWDCPPVRQRGRAIIGGFAAAGAMLMIASAVEVHPFQLAYFNRFAGGPSAGYRYLDDSNIDWGQDLPGLADWQADHASGPLVLSYFGTDDPAGYGIDSRPMRDDELLQPERAVYAISMNVLIGLKLRALETGQPEFDWLARRTPAGTIGYSIAVYDLR